MARRLLGAAILSLIAWNAAHDISGVSPRWPFVAAWIALALTWLAAPEMAIALSAPLARRNLVLDADQRASSLRYALRHWRYFDRFVSAETHWLVPDNFQESPEPVIASRTSPTNIGLQLLSTMSACDLGFLTRSEMLDRLERAFDSLDRMSRVHGHFYNWYDLSDLRVLDPPYVSTVDCGNLAGHLVALAQDASRLPTGRGRRALWSVLDAEGIHTTAGVNGRAQTARRGSASGSLPTSRRRWTPATSELAATPRERRHDALGEEAVGCGGDELSQLQLDAGGGRDLAPQRVAHLIRRGGHRRSA